MSLKSTLEKIKKTLSLAQPFIVGVVVVWFSVDISLYVIGGVSLLVSAIDYAELFIKE
jgi:hypothetical protein